MAWMKRTLLGIAGLACLAAAPAWASSGPGKASVRLDDSRPGLFDITGTFTVKAPLATAWSVLTDYNCLSKVVSSLKQSRVIRRQGNQLLVRQDALGRFLFFTRRVRVLLHIVEHPDTRIEFEDVSQASFQVYHGSWTLKPEAGPAKAQAAPGRADGVQVTYHLVASRDSIIPESIIKAIFRSNALDLLEQIRSQMRLRAEHPEMLSACDAAPTPGTGNGALSSSQKEAVRASGLQAGALPASATPTAAGSGS